MIVFAAIAPHPPASIPGIGKKEDLEALKKTTQAFEVLKKGLKEARPDTIVIISPHAHMEAYSFVINSDVPLKGGLSNFGLDEVYEYENDIEIADKLVYACQMSEFPAHLHPSFLDHGTLVPLLHLAKDMDVCVVQLSFSLMSYEWHYNYGEMLQKVLDDNNGRRVAIIASADLSHRLTPDAPAGFSPTATQFDCDIIHHLGENDIASILKMRESMSIEAAECGMRSIMVLLGALHGKRYKFNLLSYEHPFGIGHMVARLV